MAKRYRTYKRVRMTARSAQQFRETLATKTLESHFEQVCKDCGLAASPTTNYCKSCEKETKKKWKNWSCKAGTCAHVEKRTLDCARLVEAGTHISSTKGYIDLPPDDPELLRILADRIRGFAGKAGKAASAFLRVAEAAENHARRGWLHQLAECALDVDMEQLGEE